MGSYIGYHGHMTEDAASHDREVVTCADGMGLSEGELLELRRAHARWKAQRRDPQEKRVSPRRPRFATLGGIEVPDLLTPEDGSVNYVRDLGFPGEFPFTRGVYPTMYRSRLWTMRMFAGFGSARQTNERFHYLLQQGQTGLSTAFDFPTLMGYDSDSPLSLGEVGMCGVAVDTLRDMEILFEGIPLDKVTTSMTINGPAIVLLAFYVALADRRGIPRDRVGGTIQNDCLKEFIAQHAWVVPPRPAMRIVTDMIEFCTEELPRWNTVSISGYHIREAGASAVQELAFTLADGLEYVRWGVKRGLDPNVFGKRLSFFFDVHSDFFEEIAKFRAARRLWARLLKERFGVTDERALMLRTHAQTAGVSLTAQQPQNNIARVALQAMAGALGGTNSLHTNSMDETYALPTEETVKVALRTQQIVAEESGVTHSVDPLAGSYYVEWLTDRLERDALQYIEHIDSMGGMVDAIDAGYPQREVAANAYRLQRALESGERIMVGVNAYCDPEEGEDIPTLRVDERVQRAQVAFLAEVKGGRDDARVHTALRVVRETAAGDGNLMPPIIEAAKAHCTEQEICDVLRDVFGQHQDTPQF